MKSKIKDHAQLERVAPGIVQNTDREAFLAFTAERDRRSRDKERLDNLEAGFNELNQKLDDILKALGKSE